MNNFYFPYEGNKKTEISKIMQYVEIDKYKIFVEPFGGSVAFARHVYSQDKTKKIYISDNNNNLTNFCNDFYKNFEANIIEAQNTIDTLNTKELYTAYMHDKSIKDTPIGYFINNTFYTLRKGYYGNNIRKPKYLMLRKHGEHLNKFFENNTYHNRDYKDVLLEYKDNEDAVVFLDPPYIVGSKGLYHKDANIDWEYLEDFFKTCKCKFIMILGLDFFMMLVFKTWFAERYIKKYGRGTTTEHVVYTNIKTHKSDNQLN